MEKNNKSLIVVLIIIIVLLLGMIGFMYVKFNSDSNNKENVVTDNNKKDSNENDDNVEDNCLDSKLVEKFIGNYSYKGEYVDSEGNDVGDDNLGDDAWSSGKMTYEKLSLFSDGTANASAGNVRAGGYSASGKWYISNNELIILNDTCKAYEISNDGEIVYGNCQPIWSYSFEITDNNIVISSGNNSMVKVILNKVND